MNIFALPPASPRLRELSSTCQVCATEWETVRGRHSRHVPGRRCCAREACICGKSPALRRRRLPHFAALPEEPSHLFKSRGSNLPELFGGHNCKCWKSAGRREVLQLQLFHLSHLMGNRVEKQNWHAELMLREFAGCRRGGGGVGAKRL